MATKSGPLQSADYVVSKPLWEAKEPADPTDATPHRLSENLGAPDSWRQSAASVRGKLHAHRALWREDAFALGNVGNWSVGIVSDGAGSAPLSRVGSRVACDKAMESLRVSLGQIADLGDDASALQTTDLPRVRAALMGAASDALGRDARRSRRARQAVDCFCRDAFDFGAPRLAKLAIVRRAFRSATAPSPWIAKAA